MEQIQRSGGRSMRRKTKEPDKRRVVLHNDDITTFEFVIRMLMEIFFYEEDEAWRLADRIDREGRGVAGVYTKDVAESKAEAGIAMARAENFPLRITTEDV